MHKTGKVLLVTCIMGFMQNLITLSYLVLILFFFIPFALFFSCHIENIFFFFFFFFPPCDRIGCLNFFPFFFDSAIRQHPELSKNDKRIQFPLIILKLCKKVPIVIIQIIHFKYMMSFYYRLHDNICFSIETRMRNMYIIYYVNVNIHGNA